MSEEMKVKEAVESESREGSVLTKKDIDKAYFRWWMTAGNKQPTMRGCRALHMGQSMIPTWKSYTGERVFRAAKAGSCVF